MYSGFLNILKPAGMTSHDLVALVRRILRQKKVGHSGTLDPNASGVMVIALGAATRLLEYLDGDNKEYIGLIRLGIDTDTYDADGVVTQQYPELSCTMAELQAAAAKLIGRQLQQPPMVSAVRIGGKRLYEYARNGVEIDVPHREIFIYQLDLVPLEDKPQFVLGDLLRMKVRCSKGTYVRSLAYDLGHLVGGGAHLASLLRTESDGFVISDALTIEEMVQLVETDQLSASIRSAEQSLKFKQIQLQQDNLKAVLNGNPINLPLEAESGELFSLVYKGRLIAIAQYRLGSGQAYLQPVKVLADGSYN